MDYLHKDLLDVGQQRGLQGVEESEEILHLPTLVSKETKLHVDARLLHEVNQLLEGDLNTERKLINGRPEHTKHN